MGLIHKIGCYGRWTILQGYCSTRPQVIRRQLSIISSSRREKFRQEFQQYTGGSVDLVRDPDTRLATILINNPDKKNALSGKMILDLEEAVRELEHWDTGRGVILTGAGEAFCSGGDVTTLHKIPEPELAYLMSEFIQDLTFRLLNLPLVSMAAMQGPVVGGGAEIMLACDFRLMTDSPRSQIRFNQATLGIPPGWGASTKLVNLIGRTKALHLLCSGKLVNAREALAIGLVDQVCPDGSDVAAEARRWLTENLVPSKTAVDAIKTMVNVASNLEQSAAMTTEKEIFSKVWGDLHTGTTHQKDKPGQET